MGFLGKLFSALEPTKASIDGQIADLQQKIYYQQADAARWRAAAANATDKLKKQQLRNTAAACQRTIAQYKAKIAELRAQRKYCKK